MSNIISADVSDDLKDRVEDAREQKGDEKESRSATVKRLIRRGLEAEEPGFSQPFTIYMAWLGTLAAAAGLLDATEIVGIGGAVLFTMAMMYHVWQN